MNSTVVTDISWTAGAASSSSVSGGTVVVVVVVLVLVVVVVGAVLVVVGRVVLVEVVLAGGGSAIVAAGGWTVVLVAVVEGAWVVGEGTARPASGEEVVAGGSVDAGVGAAVSPAPASSGPGAGRQDPSTTRVTARATTGERRMAPSVGPAPQFRAPRPDGKVP